MTFDHIVVGAGSAGCVLANRLSADPSVSVLLIELGGPDSKPEIHIPAGYAKLHRTKVDAGFWTEPQKHLNNRKIYLPRGKVLGGCSSTNAMAYVRGNKQDYNDWANQGCQGWGYQDVLPYFKKSEFNVDHQDAFHGNHGELHVEYAKGFKTPFIDPFIAGCTSQGFYKNPDYNGQNQEGVGAFQFTIKNAKRHSAVDAFLKPVLHRKNLKVLTSTQVQKVIIKNDKAVGVIASIKNGPPQEIMANKEVILSAGSFVSPQLLMLSGIGEKEELNSFGIELKKELPGVGKNLQDHLFYAVSGLSNIQKGQNHHVKPLNQVLDLIEYFALKKGALTIGPLEGVAFGRSTQSPDRVDYQFHFASIHLGNDYKADLYDISTFPTTDGFTILPTLLRPKSRGAVSLGSKNPSDHLKIQPNFLEEESDRKILIESGKIAWEVLNSGPFKPYLEQIITPPLGTSDEAFWDHIQKQVETVYHPVGTCKMGVDPATAVVDAQLRVHGIENLRVIDASVMPTIVSGNTNAPTYMIAEKGAELILKS